MVFVRSVSRAACAAAVLFLLSSLPAHAQTLSDGFVPDVLGTVNAMAIAPSTGQVVIGGSFTQVAGQTRTRLARVNHDGTLDAGFAPAVNATVSAVAVQANGGVLIGGGFFQVAGQTRNRLARLAADGSLDAAFNPNPNGEVRAIVVLPSGQIVVGGFFTTIGGQTRNHVALLNADGSVDAAFNPNVNGSVYALRRQNDGRFLVGGSFTAVSSTTRRGLARLSSTGALDTAFGDPALTGGTVFSVDAQPDGSVVAGGGFTQASGLSHARIVRLRPDGTPDPAFAASANNTVSLVLLQPDGGIVLGGGFAQVNGTAHARLARLTPAGELDPGFSPVANSDVLAGQVAGDGRLVLGGSFTQLGGSARRGLARVDLQGYLDADSTLTTGGPAFPYARFFATMPDGGTVVAGLFQEVNGQPQPRIAKVKPDDTLDPGFSATLDVAVPYALVPLPDGRLLVGGYLTTLNGQPVSDVVALLPNGALDSSFAVSNQYLGVNAVVPLPDGRFLVAAKGSDDAHNLVRLNADGSEDTTFAVGADGEVVSAAPMPDGTVLLGGTFTHIGPRANPAGGAPRARIARLTATGALDTGFAPTLPNPADTPRVFAPQEDGRLLVGFNSAPGLLRLFPNGGVDASLTTAFDSSLTCLIKQADGRFYVAGLYTQVNGTDNFLPQRLNAVGAVDPAFTTSSDGQTYLFQQRADGKLWGAGQFTTFDGAARFDLYRLSATLPATQTLTWDDATHTALWTQARTSPAAVLPPVLQMSLDGEVFSDVGPMTKFGAFWSRTGLAPPSGAVFYLRVRAYTAGGLYNNGYSLLYSTRQAFSADADRLFANGFEP